MERCLTLETPLFYINGKRANVKDSSLYDLSLNDYIRQHTPYKVQSSLPQFRLLQQTFGMRNREISYHDTARLLSVARYKRFAVFLP